MIWDPHDRVSLQTARAVIDTRAAATAVGVIPPNELPAMLAAQGLLMHADPAWPMYSLSSAEQQNFANHVTLLGIIALSRARLAAEVAAALEQAQIRFLVIKGVALAVQAWGHASARGAGDLDVFVAEEDVSAVAGVLADFGAVPQRTDRDLRPRARDRAMHHALTFGYRDTGVDVHYRLDTIPSVMRMSFDECFARSSSVQIGSRSVPTLSLDDALLLAACNGGRDAWVKWGSVLDVVAMWRRKQAPAAELMARAVEVGAAGRLAVALALGRLVDPSLPEQSRPATAIARRVLRMHAQTRRDSVWVDRRRAWASFGIMLSSVGEREAYAWGARQIMWQGDPDLRPGYGGPGAAAVESVSKLAQMGGHLVGIDRRPAV